MSRSELIGVPICSHLDQIEVTELPDKIDHEEHAAMIQQKFGIDPGKLAEKAIAKGLA